MVVPRLLVIAAAVLLLLLAAVLDLAMAQNLTQNNNGGRVVWGVGPGWQVHSVPLAARYLTHRPPPAVRAAPIPILAIAGEK